MTSLLQGQDISFDIGFGNIPLVVYGALGITSFVIAATTVMQISKSSEGSSPATVSAPESSPTPEPTPPPASESSEEKTEGGKSKNRKSKSKKNKQNKSKCKK
jgi:hypothetical protein